jgi:hypothetical protein
VVDNPLSGSRLRRRWRHRRTLAGSASVRVRRIGVGRYAFISGQVTVCIACVSDALGEDGSGGKDDDREGRFHFHSACLSVDAVRMLPNQ